MADEQIEYGINAVDGEFSRWESDSYRKHAVCKFQMH